MFPLLGSKIHRWVYMLCKKKLFRNRGEYMAKKLLSLAFVRTVTSEIPGGKSAVTDWWEVSCHNLGIAPSAGEQREDSRSHGK